MSDIARMVTIEWSSMLKVIVKAKSVKETDVIKAIEDTVNLEIGASIWKPTHVSSFT